MSIKRIGLLIDILEGDSGDLWILIIVAMLMAVLAPRS